MQCEICGNTVERKNYVNVDGAILTVCNNCVRFGTIVEKPLLKKIFTPKKSTDTKDTYFTPKERKIFDYQLKSDFYKIIKSAREKIGLKQDKLALEIKERPSVISKIETGKIEPDKKLVKKLEKFLGIELMERVEEGGAKATVKDIDLTLGDIITFKKKKDD